MINEKLRDYVELNQNDKDLPSMMKIVAEITRMSPDVEDAIGFLRTESVNIHGFLNSETTNN